jgi:hypothetical protein
MFTSFSLLVAASKKRCHDRVIFSFNPEPQKKKGYANVGPAQIDPRGISFP